LHIGKKHRDDFSTNRHESSEMFMCVCVVNTIIHDLPKDDYAENGWSKGGKT